MKCTHGCCHLKTWKLPMTGNYKAKTVDRPKRRRAGVILSYNEEVLIVRSWGDNWGFPKGAIEDDEEDEFSASRELFEEAGISLSPEFIKDNGIRWIVPKGVFFILKMGSKPPSDIEKIKAIVNNDSSGVGWVNVRCMLKNCNLPCNKYFRMFLYGISEEGLNEWLANPPNGISYKVYQKVSW